MVGGPRADPAQPRGLTQRAGTVPKPNLGSGAPGNGSARRPRRHSRSSCDRQPPRAFRGLAARRKLELHALQGRGWRRRNMPSLPGCPLKYCAISARGRLDLRACLRGQPVGPAALGKPAIARLLGALPSGNRGVPSAPLGSALPHEVSPRQANCSPTKTLPFSKASSSTDRSGRPCSEAREERRSFLRVALFGAGPSLRRGQGESLTGDKYMHKMSHFSRLSLMGGASFRRKLWPGHQGHPKGDIA